MKNEKKKPILDLEKIKQWEASGKYEKWENDYKSLQEWISSSYEWWVDRLEQYPAAASTELKTVIDSSHKHLAEMKADYNSRVGDKYSNTNRNIELLQFIEAQELLLKKLEDHINGKETETKTDKIIQRAVKGNKVRKKNKKKAVSFMEIYAQKKRLFPTYNPENFIEEIGWTEHSPNTYRDWMEKYDEAEQEINDLLSNSE